MMQLSEKVGVQVQQPRTSLNLYIVVGLETNMQVVFTVALDLIEVVRRLREDLEITEPSPIQDLDRTTHPHDLVTHLTRIRKAKHDPNYVYY